MNAKQLFTKPFITLAGEVNGAMVTQFDNDLRANNVTESEEPLRILVSSVGGSAWMGEAISERIRYINRARPVQVVAVARVASAATFFFLAVPREQRFATSLTKFLLHQPRIEPSFPKQVLSGAEHMSRELEQDVQDMRQQFDRYLSSLCNTLQMKRPEVRQRVMSGWYLSAQQAVRCGFISKIIR